jgi:DNA-binding transcriptional MerR regulator
MWRVSDVANYFDVHRATVHRWTNEYSSELSDSAQGKGGKTREFTPRDVGVLAFAHKLTTKEGRTYDEALEAIQASDFDDVAEYPNRMMDLPEDLEELERALARLENAEARIVELTTRNKELEEEVGKLKQEKATLVGRLQEVERSREQVEQKEHEIRDLYKQIARLEMTIEHLTDDKE